MKKYYKLSFLLICSGLFISCSNNEPENLSGVKSLKSSVDCLSINDYNSVYSTFFKPAQGWVGDPMPFYDNGKIHIFYLHDARDGAPTFHPWYKVTTTNFASYTDNGEMIPCGDENGQERALGTGGVFKHNGVYYAFYTAHNGNLDPREKIMLATSTDLQNWTKDPSFVLEASWGYDRNEFRDPIIIRDEATNTFRMLISTRADYKGSWRAVIAQYSSTDLRNWTLEEPFYDDPATFMVECPDVFSMGEFQYLVYSDIDDRKVHYKYRKGTSGNWITPSNSAMDGVAFYAGKTVSDNYDRYIVGWCPTRSNHSDYYDFDWAGSLIAHKIIQYSDGTLALTYPHGLNDRLVNEVSPNNLKSVNAESNNGNYKLNAGAGQAYATYGAQSGTYKIKANIKASASTRFGFEFESCSDRREIYSLVFDLEQEHIRLDRKVTGEEPWRIEQVNLDVTNKDFDVTIIVENSICVVYINHQIAFTNRIYMMNQNPWGIFADNGEVEFQNLKVYK